VSQQECHVVAREPQTRSVNRLCRADDTRPVTEIDSIVVNLAAPDFSGREIVATLTAARTEVPELTSLPDDLGDRGRSRTHSHHARSAASRFLPATTGTPLPASIRTTDGGSDARFNRVGSPPSYVVRHIACTARATSDTSVTATHDGSAAAVAASGGGWNCASGE
jgi:hypothetical protein